MANFLSPSVIVSETDATLGVTEQSDKLAAISGAFQWGPIDEPTLVTGGETEFVTRFGKPNDATANFSMVALDFLAYSNSIWVNRQTGAAARNAFPGIQTPELVKNDSDFLTANLTGTDFIAKYAGSLGNGLAIDICDTAGFDAWEFNNSFTYKPLAGEFSVAVVDTTGLWSGQGGNAQSERLLVNGTATGGIQQKQTITVTGSATGGTRQEETLTFVGTATDVVVNVNGTAVTLVAGDNAATVATKVATALAAIPATYASAVANANTVHVVFTAPTTNQVAISGGTQNGVTWTSVVTVSGIAEFILPVYSENVTVSFGDSATIVAGKIYQVFAGKTALYSSVNQPTAGKVQYTFVAYGPQTVTPTVTANGVTLATAADIAGNSNIVLSVFGVNVTVTNGDSAATVSAKIGATPAFQALWGTSSVFAAYVTYVRTALGPATLFPAPANQAGLTFLTQVTNPGRTGTVIESYELLSNDPTAKSSDGTTKYWRDAINQGSVYVRACDKNVPLSVRTTLLQGGVDDQVVVVNEGYEKFRNTEAYTVQYLIAPAVSVNEQRAIVDVAETRMDCMAFVAPMIDDVVNNKTQEMAAVNNWRINELNEDSTYSMAVDNWGYMYDKYNDVYRWIPATGGTAGLAARTAVLNDPWISFAGFQRGRYLNYVKMAWSSSQDDRDQLYKTGINSIATFPSQGIVLFGDKTLTSRPSAFGHVNVRWAFIVAKVSLADMAKYFLFELNTAFTRAQFVNAARPFLRNMVSRNAFEDFQVICDLSNNGGDVRAANKMIVQILLKPVYSINWVVLNLTAVRPDVSFTEIIQQN